MPVDRVKFSINGNEVALTPKTLKKIGIKDLISHDLGIGTVNINIPVDLNSDQYQYFFNLSTRGDAKTLLEYIVMADFFVMEEYKERLISTVARISLSLDKEDFLRFFKYAKDYLNESIARQLKAYIQYRQIGKIDFTKVSVDYEYWDNLTRYIEYVTGDEDEEIYYRALSEYIDLMDIFHDNPFVGNIKARLVPPSRKFKNMLLYSKCADLYLTRQNIGAMIHFYEWLVLNEDFDLIKRVKEEYGDESTVLTVYTQSERFLEVNENEREYNLFTEIEIHDDEGYDLSIDFLGLETRY